MSNAKDKALELLGAGLPNVVVANALGVSESLVSQWLSVDEFAVQVQQRKIQVLTEAKNRDSKWNTLEDKLLERLEELLPMLSNPMAVVQALRTVNGAVRRAAPQELGATAQATHVHLHMPALIAAKFTVNGNNQVVEVDGRNVSTMPANVVVEEMKRRAAERTVLPAANSEEADREQAMHRVSQLQRLEHLPVHELV